MPASAARREAWARPITSKAAGSRADRLREPSCEFESRGRARMLWMPSPRAAGGEMEPTKVTCQVGRVEGEPMADGVEARTLTRLELQVVYFDDHWIRERRGADHIAFDEKETGVVTSLDRGCGQLHHAGQGGRNAAGREEGSSDGRKIDRVLGNRVSTRRRFAGECHGDAPVTYGTHRTRGGRCSGPKGPRISLPFEGASSVARSLRARRNFFASAVSP